jgi:hypothetical protein
MQIPQEIVDAIIDNFAVFDDDRTTCNEPCEADTLRVCALVSRSFLPRSQRQLFALLTCLKGNLLKLERLLVESPHIGTYVRFFSLFLPGIESPILCDNLVSVSRFMPLLPHLTHLEVIAGKYNRPWEPQPLFLKSALQAAFSLPSLRSIHLSRYSFIDVYALEALLSHAIGLKELSLDAIDFIDTCARPVSLGPRRASVVLESLRMTYIKSIVTESIASAFRMVDITQLRSLDLRMTRMVPLLKKSGPNIQKLRLYYPPCASK